MKFFVKNKNLVVDKLILIEKIHLKYYYHHCQLLVVAPTFEEEDSPN
jgi:hypothetical protein